MTEKKSGHTSRKEAKGEYGMLSEKEVEALTLRAPFVHEHGDRPYFMHELNSVAAQLQEVAHLNFFVRYRSEPGEATKHKWSRIVRVVFLEDALRTHKSGAGSDGEGTAAPTMTAAAGGGRRPVLTVNTDLGPTISEDHPPGTGGGPPRRGSTGLAGADPASSTVVWRNKLFWIGLEVVGEGRPIHLPRLSASLPTAEEVRQYCAYQSLMHPTEVYATVHGGVEPGQSTAESAVGVLDATVDESQTEGEPALLTGGVAGEGARPRPALDPNAVARTYLPTSAQIRRLSDFREVHLVRHAWTTAETEEAARLHERYATASTGAAVAPMAATVNRVRNLQLETKLMRSAAAPQLGPQLAPPQSPGSPASPTTTTATATQPQTSTKRNLRGQAVYTGRSPFLPRRLREGPAGGAEMEMDSRGSATATPAPSQARPPRSAFDDAVPPLPQTGPGSSQIGHGGGAGGDTESPSIIAPETVELWHKEYDAQLNFYRYIADEQRSGYLNKIAHITNRNALENRRNRLVGIEMEKQRSRQANFVESGGLWVTDDRGRAEKAAQYKAAVEREPAAGDAKKGKAAPGAGEQARQAAEEAARRASEQAEKQERLLSELQRAHTARTTSFASVPEEWLRADVSSDTGRVVGRNGAATDAPAGPPRSVGAVRGHVSPNRLQLPAGTAGAEAPGAVTRPGKRDREEGPGPVERLRIASQLLHRSAAVMAGQGGSAARAARAENVTAGEPENRAAVRHG